MCVGQDSTVLGLHRSGWEEEAFRYVPMQRSRRQQAQLKVIFKNWFKQAAMSPGISHPAKLLDVDAHKAVKSCWLQHG